MALNYVDLKLVRKGLEYTRKNRNLVVALGALGVTGYGAYKAYYSASMVKKREKFLKLIGAVASLAEMVSDSSEVIGIVSKDLKEFIASDSDQIPRSLKQISKIAKSDEFSQSVVKVTTALTVGVVRGCPQETSKNVVDHVWDKLFSDAGTGFASVIIGSFARNLVLAEWIDVLCQDKVRHLIGSCVQVFVSTAVAVYLDKTMKINTYNDIFSGLTNPKHEAKMRDMLVSICSGAIGTLVKTSHQVLTSPDMDMDMYSTYKDYNVWKVPRNKGYILDLTGRVTFESVRSFLEFLLEKLRQCLRKSVHVIQEDMIDRSTEAYRYMSGKSSAAVSVCLTLCLHILNGPWILVPN